MEDVEWLQSGVPVDATNVQGKQGCSHSVVPSGQGDYSFGSAQGVLGVKAGVPAAWHETFLVTPPPHSAVWPLRMLEGGG